MHALRVIALAVGFACFTTSACTPQRDATSQRDTNRDELRVEAPSESRGLLPIIGYQVPLEDPEKNSGFKLKVLYLMPAGASAPLDARFKAPLPGCTVVPEITATGTNRVVINIWLTWTTGRVADSSECIYDPATAKEAHVLVDGLSPTAAILTGGPIAEVDHSEAEEAKLGNKIPLLPEQRPPGG